jgi:hypothetical protein
LSAADDDWLKANQTYLTRQMARLKAAMRREPPPNPPVWAKARGARPPAIEALAAAFELSSFERDLLLLCAAVELDPEVSELCATAAGGSGRASVTFSLALSVLPEGHWSALGPQAALRRWRLIKVAENQPLTLAALRIDETVLHALAGIDALDPSLAAVISSLPAIETAALAPTHAALARLVALAWDAGADRHAVALARLVGEPAECRPIVAAAAAACHMKSWLLGADAAPTDPDSLDRWARLWRRQSRLTGPAVLMLELGEGAHTEEARSFGAASRLLERLTGPLALADPDRTFPRRAGTTSFEVGGLPMAVQREVWTAALRRGSPIRGAGALKAVEATADLVAVQFSLGQSAIETIAAEAARATRMPEESRPVGEIAWDLARSSARSRLDGLAQRMESNFVWDDLVLPEAETATLRAIAAQLRQRMTVYERWGFAQKSARGLGISALFAGPSGAGKTMAAEVLARDLRLDLYRIDLSSVVSKYIGETEKNLRRVFDGAEQSGAVLLFDEADALFGRRSEVKDSHDRYANIEVSFLLQQMEAYRGLAILTSNMKSALDPAFLRRLRFVIQFPFPGLEERQRLWAKAFPMATPTEDLDLSRLAQLRVTGGTIRSIAMNAAFLAAEAGASVRMSHLREAARIEYTKLERNLTAGELEAWL